MAAKYEGSPLRPAGASPSSRPNGASEGGFTLVEAVVAMAILIVGLLSLAQLLGVSIRAESLARNGAEATRLAPGQLDALMKANFDNDPRVQPTPSGTDSLESERRELFRTPTHASVSSVAGEPGARWHAGSSTVRVIVPVRSTTMRVVDLTSLLRRW